MKKILFFVSALAGLCLAASCQQENLEPVAGGNTVTYTVQLPDAIGTKAIGTNVSSVTELIYEVYRIDENGDETRLYQMTEEMTGGSATVELELVNNQDFRVLFWAQVPETGIYNTDNLKAVELSTTLNANAENYAAFANQDVITYGENLVGRTIQLVRPVAQLNIATSAESLKLGEDVNGENAQTTVSFETTGVVVEGLSTVYNVAEGAGVAANDGATFTYEAKPVALSENTIKVNNVDYTYVSMNYVGFASKTGDNVKVSYTINTENVGTITNTVENVPVKANYRTNIIGNLITSTSDYTVTLDNTWPAEEINVEVVSVSTAAELVEAIKGASTTEGEETNIKLEGNIDLGALAGLISTKADEPVAPTYGLLIPADKTLVLDLNGNILSQTVNQTGAYSMIQNNGHLTIIDSKGTGKISYTDNGNGGEYVSNTIVNNATMIIESGVIENNSSANVAANGYPHPMDNNGNLTINGGTLKNNANYASMRIWCTTDDNTSVTINGGTFNGSIDFQSPSAAANKGTLTINGGTFLADTYTNSAVRLLGFGADVDEMFGYIKGGNFTGEIAIRNWSGQEMNSQVFYISGGTFNTDVNNFTAEASVAVKEGDVWVVRDAYAKVGNTKYTSLDAALAAAADQETVTVLADTEIGAPFTLANGKTLTLDLNGKTVAGSSSATGKNYDMIDVRGTLTVKNGTITAEFTGENMGWNNSTNVFNVTAGGVLNLNGVTAKNLGGSDMGFVAHLNNWGEVTLNVEESILESNYVAVRVFNSGYDMNNVTIKNSTLKGGSYAFWVHNYTTADFSGDAEKAAHQQSLLNLDIFDNGNTFIGKNDTPIRYGMTDAVYTAVPAAAKIGDTEYTSLQAAIDAVKDGETIVLMRDVKVIEPAYGQNALNHNRPVNFTLDLNKKTLSADTGNSVFRFNISATEATENVTVTIKNGIVTSGDNTWCTVMATGLSDAAKAVFNLVDLTINSSKPGDFAVKSWANAVINANNVTVNATKCAGGFYAVGGEIVLDNCTVNQTGLWTSPYMSMAVAVSTSGKLTVNSGNYTTTPTAASEGYNQGTSHGSWAAGVMNSGGKLIINGGTFANGNYGDDALATYARGLIFGDTASEIVINGGTFNALKSIIDYQNNLGIQPNPNIMINGGNFSADPSVVTSYGGVEFAEGKAPVQGADGRWTLIDAVTTEDALKAAFEQGGDIVLGADITVSETLILAEGKTVVLDLNGKKLSAADINVVKNNGGNLTIKNGTVTRTGDVVGYSVNNASGEITVENATIKRGLYTSGSKMTATNANISHEQSSRHAIYAWNCEVTINSGTFHNDNAGNATLMASGSSVVTINGGTFSIADGRSSLGWTSSMIDQNSTSQVIVKGGLFNGGFRINSADTKLTIEGGEFNTNNGSAFTDYSGTKVVKGGKFTDAGAQNWAKKYIAEGYEMNANGEVVAK